MPWVDRFGLYVGIVASCFAIWNQFHPQPTVVQQIIVQQIIVISPSEHDQPSDRIPIPLADDVQHRQYTRPQLLSAARRVYRAAATTGRATSPYVASPCSVVITGRPCAPISIDSLPVGFPQEGD
jgi:hypothetical protein